MKAKTIKSVQGEFTKQYPQILHRMFGRKIDLITYKKEDYSFTQIIHVILNELLDDGINFKQINEELRKFIYEKASSIIEVILNNILDLLGNMNSRLTYYKPSPKAFTEAGRSRRVEAGEIDTDTAIEYYKLIGLIQER